ncbi:MAG: Ig-like domain-containing protein [Luteolibacter sp.]
MSDNKPKRTTAIFLHRLKKSTLTSVFAACGLTFNLLNAAITPTTTFHTISLTWNAVPELNIQGYRLYVGTQSQQYTQTYNTGTQITYPVDQLEAGKTYYFAVRAVGSTGVEGPLSVELPVTINPQPIAVADSYSATRNTPLVIPAKGVLANDTDMDSVSLSAVLDEAPAHGTVTLNEDGGFTYTPSSGFIGSDSFGYHASDGLLNSAEAMVSINVGLPTSQLIVNGSFENNNTGWTSTGSQSIQSASPYEPTNGTKLAVFNGGNMQPGGVLSQSFATVVGQTYTVGFDAGVLAYNTNSQQVTVTVTGNSALLSNLVTINGIGNGANVWVSKSLTFVADSTTATLTFRDTSLTTDSLDLLLDNVSVIGPVATDSVVTPPESIGSPSIAGGAGSLTVSMTVSKTGSYTVERSQDLVNWEILNTTQISEPGKIEFTDTKPPTIDNGTMFYRIGCQ